jgi:hypothetical protein
LVPVECRVERNCFREQEGMRERRLMEQTGILEELSWGPNE